jgi:hypothetical protein
MPYPGISKELTSKMDRCVQKVMKDGKDKSSAIAICKTSIMSQTKKEEEKPYKVVKSKDQRYVMFSNSPVKDQTINASKEGKLLKNVEIFKAGTYRGIDFKNSALDKMVANFYYLKAHGVFPHVPVRADHPPMGIFGGGEDIIDKVGGYIADLKRVGKKLVADFRITSENMWNKVSEGSYVNRSTEIGTYDDNEGNIYSPTLLGVAWVDIPQVEGLSPTFSYKKGENKDNSINLINLNNPNDMSEEIKDVFPPEEAVETPAETPGEGEAPTEEAGQPEGETPVEETPVETPAEEPVAEEPKEEMKKDVISFEKAFPKEFQELQKAREEAFTGFFSKLVSEGKIVPAMKEQEMKFAKTLSEKQLALYKEIKEKSPKVVELDKEPVEGEEPVKPEVGDTPEGETKAAEERADKFINETN